MDIRQANPGDADAIREVARRSLRDSYTPPLDADAIESAVDRWYGKADLEERLADGDTLFLVVDVEDHVVGFSQSEVVEGEQSVGEIHWVHVEPDHRGHDYGDRVLDRTEETLHARGVDRIEALVLAANEAGNEFYEEHDYRLAGEREVEIGDETFAENAYVKGSAASADQWLSARELPDGREVYVDRSEPEHGSKGAFYPVYYDRERERRHGMVCDNCGSFETAMGTMGRLACAECNNVRKPTRWDAAYL